jgi:hypothetical protein
VDVDASVNVVQHVPAIVVGIFVHDKIIAAVPTPVRTDRPIPGGNFKKEAARQPEAVVVAIESLNAVAIRRTKVLEAAMFERMIDVKALIVRPVVAVPMVITDVRGGNDVAALAAFGFRLRARLAPRGRRLRNVPLVRARGILLALVAALREYRLSQKKGQSKWNYKT